MGINSAGSPNERVAKLMTNCQGLVRSIAWKIHQRLPRHVDLDDLIGFGQIGLAEAARDFDENRGVNFTTYSYYRIRGAILDGLNKMSWFSQSDYNRGKYERIANDILASGEAAEGAEASYAENLRWFASTTNALSTVYLISQLGSEETRQVESVDPDAPDDLRKVEESDLLVKLRDMVASLPDQQRGILEGVYFQGLSLKAAGERLGISKAWASRLHKQTLEQLMQQLSKEVV